MNKLVIVVLAIIALLIGVGLAIIYTQIPTTVTIKTPPNITVNPSSINWGTLIIGVNMTSIQNVTLTNIGETPSNPLQISYDLPFQATLTWNCTDLILAPSESKVAMFTLVTTEESPGDFEFNIIIEG